MPHIADPLSAAAASSPATSWADFTINTVGFSFRNGQVDDEIVVSLAKSQLSVTYHKPDKSPQLLAKRITEKYDPRTPMTVSEFLVKAWKLANDKARELGWIV
jgi:hypothetical protein